MTQREEKTDFMRVALLLNSLPFRFTVYQEIWDAVEDSLRQAGAVVRRIETVQGADPERDELVLLIGTPNYVVSLAADLAAFRAQHPRKPLVFLWHLEWLPSPDAPEPLLWIRMLKKWWDARSGQRQGDNSGAGNYLAIRHGVRHRLYDHVFVFTEQKQRFLRKHGIPAEYLPAGHHPLWGTPGQGERDIDVLFLGQDEDNRRGRIVRAVRTQLAQAGVELKTMYDFNPAGLWGEERNALLRRTKIFLSVYRHPADFSGTRFSLGMGNGALIVSEPLSDPDPFVPGEHFVQAPVAELAPTILHYLHDDAARTHICRQAAELLLTRYTMLASAQTILQRARDFQKDI